jgi:hypothetical protein
MCRDQVEQLLHASLLVGNGSAEQRRSTVCVGAWCCETHLRTPRTRTRTVRSPQSAARAVWWSPSAWYANTASYRITTHVLSHPTHTTSPPPAPRSHRNGQPWCASAVGIWPAIETVSCVTWQQQTRAQTQTHHTSDDLDAAERRVVLPLAHLDREDIIVLRCTPHTHTHTHTHTHRAVRVPNVVRVPCSHNNIRFVEQQHTHHTRLKLFLSHHSQKLLRTVRAQILARKKLGRNLRTHQTPHLYCLFKL